MVAVPANDKDDLRRVLDDDGKPLPEITALAAADRKPAPPIEPGGADDHDEHY